MPDKPIHTAGVVLFRKDFSEVLLTKHTDAARHQTGMYGIPAGRVEPDETPLQTAVRECKEETNLDLLAEDLLPLPFEYSASIQRKEEKPRVFVLQVWYCEHIQEDQIKETHENIPEWISVDALHSLPLLPNMHRVVTDARDFLMQGKVDMGSITQVKKASRESNDEPV